MDDFEKFDCVLSQWISVVALLIIVVVHKIIAVTCE